MLAAEEPTLRRNFRVLNSVFSIIANIEAIKMSFALAVR